MWKMTWNNSWKAEKIFWGMFFILGAVFILAAQMGFVEGVGFWSIFWTILLAAWLVKSIFKLEFMGIFLSLAFLGIVYAEPLGIQAITPWPILGAAVLLGIGFNMIFPKRHKSWFKKNKYGGYTIKSGDATVINDADDSETSCEVAFGATTKYINSDAFTSVRLETSFGEMKVYFDNAIMKNKDAYVFLDNSFGSTELYVPHTWTVINQLDSAFGGIAEKGRKEPDGVHSLYLRGDNSFGGVTVFYV